MDSIERSREILHRLAEQDEERNCASAGRRVNMDYRDRQLLQVMIEANPYEDPAELERMLLDQDRRLEEARWRERREQAEREKQRPQPQTQRQAEAAQQREQ